MASNESGAGPQPGMALAQGPFTGRLEFMQAIRNAVQLADREGWAEMVWSDASFEDWPLYERAVVEGLDAWARSGRKLVLLAQHFNAMHRVHPRFVTWRVRWDHLIECRVCKGISTDDFPSALWTPTWALRRLDPVRCTGVASTEARMRLLLREDLDERRRQSSPGFPASTLGL